MPFSHLSLAVCLFGACAVAGLSATPASAQAPAPAKPVAPSARALTPAQGAAQALNHAHTAKTLSALTPYLTNEFAAFFGIELGDAVSAMSDNAAPLSPEEKSSQAAEEVFDHKMSALMNRYMGIDKASKLSERPPGFPAVIAHGRQFLAEALVLGSDYEKAAPSKEYPPLNSMGSGNPFPASSACTFHVLSSTRVRIVPRTKPQILFEARLEEGQWRIGSGHPLFNESSYTSGPKMPRLTPQVAAFLKAVDDGDAAAVSRMLQAAPALANTTPAYLKAHSEKVSNLLLSIASLHHNVPMMTLLLKAGAKVNAENDFEKTALDKAAQFGSKEVVTLLLAHGADTAHQDVFGKTALYRAVEGDNPSTVAALLAHGADVNADDDEGKTPLGVALAWSSQEADHAAIIKLLRQHGAKR